VPGRQKLAQFVRRKGRSVAAESLILAVVFALAGFVLTLVIYWALQFFLAGLLSHLLFPSTPRYERVQSMSSLAHALSLLIFAGAFLQQRKTLLRPPSIFASSLFSAMFNENLEENGPAVISAILMIGPSCFVQSLYFARTAGRALSLDDGLCAAGLETSMRKLRRVTEADLPDADFARLLRHLSIFPGVVILHSAPGGFVLTAELRQEIRAAVPGQFARESARPGAWSESSSRPPPRLTPAFSELDAAYAVLGLRPGAPLKEVKAAYRRLAKLHHPDLAPARGRIAAEDKMKQINEAYDTLLEHFAERGVRA
jgi:hypothetical protein